MAGEMIFRGNLEFAECLLGRKFWRGVSRVGANRALVGMARYGWVGQGGARSRLGRVWHGKRAAGGISKISSAVSPHLHPFEMIV